MLVEIFGIILKRSRTYQFSRAFLVFSIHGQVYGKWYNLKKRFIHPKSGSGIQ